MGQDQAKQCDAGTLGNVPDGLANKLSKLSFEFSSHDRTDPVSRGLATKNKTQFE